MRRTADEKRPCSRSSSSSLSEAATTAVGCRLASSRANEGPERVSHCRETRGRKLRPPPADMVLSESDSKPLERLTRTWSSGRAAFQAQHHRADEFRRHGQDQDVGPAGFRLQVGAGLQVRGQLDAGQEDLVLPRRIDGLEDLLLPDPDAALLLAWRAR